MIRKAKYIACLSVAYICSFIAPAYSSSIDDFSFYVTNHPPLTYEKNNAVTGIAADIFAEILTKLGAKKSIDDIVLVNWARAYNQTLTTPNSLLLDAYRTEEREHLFKWVGPFMTAQPSLISKKTQNIRLKSTKDFGNYIIGTLRNDATEQLLMATGIAPENIIHLSSASQLTRLLAVGRIDILAYDWLPARWVFKNEGYNPDTYETIWTLAEPEHYITFHKSTDDALIEAIQHALDQLKQDGTIERIIKAYASMDATMQSK
ncbi:MAG: substrate-binding periplasmic protein [Kordiimonas sp.]